MLLFTDIQVVSMQEIKRIQDTGLPIGRFISYDPLEKKFLSVKSDFGVAGTEKFDDWTACIGDLKRLPSYVARQYAEEIKKENPQSDDPNDTHMWDYFVREINRFKEYKVALVFDSSKDHPEIVTLESAEQGLHLLFKDKDKSHIEIPMEEFVVIPSGKGVESAVEYKVEHIRLFAERKEDAYHNDFSEVPTMLYKGHESNLAVGYGNPVLFGQVMIMSDLKDFGETIKFLTPYLEQTRVTTCGSIRVHDIHCFTIGKYVNEELAKIRNIKVPLLKADEIF